MDKFIRGLVKFVMGLCGALSAVLSIVEGDSLHGRIYLVLALLFMIYCGVIEIIGLLGKIKKDKE